ncbi:MAG: preprotein translocase subunit YajC [Bacteroidetes bacterium]|jgi:preprotein translocase subunit YajC|nr:preprotein translocase subunit YajC [Bacteroidota bacterium]MDA0879845.1 preprotein translocase subunit YajC [Bacteroidota bacterium]MDA1115833.1 preprotein translocase subunit YajC [Bacteroidota bacterium]MDP4665691.1 preprotein translocase subunit YajC [Flavobacteriaceae bacterium]
MEGLSQFAPFILMFAVLYFFMIAPQMKRAKKERQFAAEIKKGDRVVTKSGLHGRVSELSKNGTCVLETMAGKIRFEISAISMEMSQKANKTAAE